MGLKLFYLFSAAEHLDFMNTVDTSEMVFEQFKQMEHEYIGYQSLTDVPRSLNYSEDSMSYLVSRENAKALAGFPCYL